jgi:hypothetical protein
VFDSDISFPAHEDVWVHFAQVGEEVQSEDYAAVAAVFKGDHAPVGGGRLDGGEDIFDCGLWGYRELGRWGEGVEGCLEGCKYSTKSRVVEKESV